VILRARGIPEMRPFQRINTQHKDIVHHLAYDFYGKRLATCSGDHRIKVWDFDGKTWIPAKEFDKGHNGAVTKVQWAHPEFGQIIASCSLDNTVCIWEESEGPTGSHWSLKERLHAQLRSTVTDIKFAPKHLGLRLATCSDGFIRIYEATDVTNLSHWQILDQFQSQKANINSIDWNSSPFDHPMLAAACDDHLIRIWTYNGQLKRWNLGVTLAGHTDAVHQVAWAPNLGRSYHTLASASKDKSVRIWRVTINKENGEFEAKQVAQLSKHNSPVWSVEWNITGTILASSGDDGVVRFWKPNFNGQWVNLLEVNCENSIRDEEDLGND